LVNRKGSQLASYQPRHHPTTPCTICRPPALFLQTVASGEIRILPERFEKVYNFWLDNIKDWCISRQLWWGHRIPVWWVDGAGGWVEKWGRGRGEQI
jgi:hypothetical protein